MLLWQSQSRNPYSDTQDESWVNESFDRRAPEATEEFQRVDLIAGRLSAETSMSVRWFETRLIAVTADNYDSREDEDRKR